MGTISDCTRKLANAHLFGSSSKAFQVTIHFVVEICEYQSEGDRFGMDAMRPADHGSVLEFQGPAAEYFMQTMEIVAENGGSFFDLQSLGSIDDVVRGQAVVQPASFGANFFGDGGGKRDYIMADFCLDFVNPLQVEIGFAADCLGSSFGDKSGIGESLGGSQFDFQPFPELVLVGPDSSHFGTCITCNHELSPRDARASHYDRFKESC